MNKIILEQLHKITPEEQERNGFDYELYSNIKPNPTIENIQSMKMLEVLKGWHLQRINVFQFLQFQQQLVQQQKLQLTM